MFPINNLTVWEDSPVKAIHLKLYAQFWGFRLDLSYSTLLLINFSASETRLMTRGPFDFIRESVKKRRAAGAVGHSTTVG